MDLAACFEQSPVLLMEAALGTRLKQECGLSFDGPVAMADLVLSDAGRGALRSLWLEYAGIARKYGLPFLATTPTRRANRERMREAGYLGKEGDSRSAAAGVRLFAENVALVREVMREVTGEEECQTEESAAFPAGMYVGGLMGCRGDAYTGEGAIASVEEARAFHAWQAQALADAGVDFLLAGIMPTLTEARGMALAMAETGLPYVISFTVLAGGTLVDGTPIHNAIERIDAAAGHANCCAPLCYMSNCVHPETLLLALDAPCNRTELVRRRFGGIQANASKLSLAALDALAGTCTVHEDSPEALAAGMLRLHRQYGLRILGGCCGTTGRHLEAIARAAAAEM